MVTGSFAARWCLFLKQLKEQLLEVVLHPRFLLLERKYYSFKDQFSRFMLPEPENCPSIRLKSGCLLLIAARVPFQFLAPVSPVGRRFAPMFGAAVPEASIDKKGNPVLCERDIWADYLSVDSYRIVFPESKASAMKAGTYLDFRLCVSTPDGCHVARPAW
jgi:hypothetical protein